MSIGSEQRLKNLADRFETGGGRFVTPIGGLAERIARVRGLVFDWDGVFNPGTKAQDAPSGFTETDSMGLNMLRYGLWRRHGELPVTAIVTGESNATAIAFARRERLTVVHVGIGDKRLAIDAICARHELDPAALACVFDDINDLPMAARCGLRFQARRDANPMLVDYTTRRGLCDYVAGSRTYPVREVCDLMLGILGAYDEVVDSRVARDERYETYWRARQSVATDVVDGRARPVDAEPRVSGGEREQL